MTERDSTTLKRNYSSNSTSVCSPRPLRRPVSEEEGVGDFPRATACVLKPKGRGTGNGRTAASSQGRCFTRFQWAVLSITSLLPAFTLPEQIPTPSIRRLPLYRTGSYNRTNMSSTQRCLWSRTLNSRTWRDSPCDAVHPEVHVDPSQTKSILNTPECWGFYFWDHFEKGSRRFPQTCTLKLFISIQLPCSDA